MRLLKRKSTSKESESETFMLRKSPFMHLTPNTMRVGIARDMYVMCTLDNELLVSELKTRYDRNDCVIKKREERFNQLFESAVDLWVLTEKLNEELFVKNFLLGVSNVFQRVMYMYLSTAEEHAHKDPFVYQICIALAENEWRNLHEFNKVFGSRSN